MRDLPIGQVFNWEDVAIAMPDQIISSAIAENDQFDFTVFGFGAGESISTEIVNTSKLIYVLSGQLMIEHEDQFSLLEVGELLFLEEGVRHAIEAKTHTVFQQIHIYQKEEKYMINKIPHNETMNLADQIDVLPNKKASKALVQRKDLTLTLFALDAGQQIAKHTATGDALVQILEGEAGITIDEKDFVVKTGESIVMPAEIPHALEAKTAFKMLLTVVKASE